MNHQPLTFAQWRALDDDQREARLNADAEAAWIVPPSKFPRIETGQGPLSGLVFAAKDNIDVAGVPTTAGCPEFAYTPAMSSYAVQRLIAAGAAPVGKTNLDQFATGLVGTRSPYGIVRNVHNPAYVGGGSSSGSAALVARGIVPFALGTDTAGSGRVPAGLQGVVGLKPTRGWISCRGVVPACRSLDCVSVFAATVGDAALVASVLGAYDPEDGYSRERPAVAAARPTRRLAVPSTLDWFGDELQAQAWEASLAKWRWLGYELVAVDPAPLFAMAALLYEGPWVAERVAALTGFFPENSDAMHPVVRKILEGASRFDAASVFRAEDRRRELQAVISRLWDGCDALLVPTVPRPYTVDEVLADPIATNSKLGTWTNFVNLADLCALSVPAGTRADDFPFGVTLIGRAWQDFDLAVLGREWEAASDEVRVAVVGAHLSGLPLNHLLTKRGGRLVRAGQTAPSYRLFALEDQTPPKPGLIRVAEGGAGVALEIWSLPRAAYGAFVAEIPPPLGIGTLELDDGGRVQGFLCEAWAVEGRRDITQWGGWKAWLASRSPT
jgi:allophanate hydrolase